jgi:MFS family permease
MNTEPTNTEKMRRLPWSIASLTFNSVFAQITFGGPVFVLFLDQLGLPKTGIGFLLSLFPFCGLLALVIGPAVARFGFKRTFIVFYGSRKLVFALLLLTPAVVNLFGLQVAYLFVSAVILIFAILRSIAETGYNPWFQEFVPNAIRGRYSAVSNIATNLASAIALGVASLVIAQSESLDRFMLLIGVGVLFGLTSIFCALFIPGGAPLKASGPSTHMDDMLETLLNRDFVLYLVGLALITLGSAPLSFVPLMMKERAGLPEGMVVMLSSFTMIGGLISSYIWGWVADRWGSRPVVLLSVCALSFIPLVWLLVPSHAISSEYIAIAVALLAGLTNAGWSVGSVRLLFNSIVPPEKKTDYLSLHYAWSGLIGGIGPLLAGGLLDVFKAGGIRLGGVTLDGYTPLFIAGFVLSIASIFFLIQVNDYQSISTRRLARMFLNGNLLSAAHTLIQYRRARDESERVSVTEQLGSSKSLLTVDELLDALSDPSFNVRHEAIVSIARLKPDERLFNALVEVLLGNEPDLSISAAWALGRLGDRRAIEPLREAFGSRYALIQARSARALATLGDYDIIPILLERLKTEPDDGLRIAYASALGSLHCKDAVPLLLPFLQATRGKDPRMELSLALARMVGQADYFVILARQTRTSPGMPLGRAIAEFQRHKNSHKLSASFVVNSTACIEAFEKEDIERGIRNLVLLTNQLPLDQLRPLHATILRECALRMTEYGAARLEYGILAIHTLHMALTLWE